MRRTKEEVQLSCHRRARAPAAAGGVGQELMTTMLTAGAGGADESLTRWESRLETGAWDP